MAARRPLRIVRRKAEGAVLFDVYPPSPRSPETMRDIIVFLTALKVEAWLGTCEQDPERVLLIKPTAEQLPQVENFWTGLKSSPTPSAVTTPR